MKFVRKGRVITQTGTGKFVTPVGIITQALVVPTVTYQKAVIRGRVFTIPTSGKFVSQDLIVSGSITPGSPPPQPGALKAGTLTLLNVGI